MGYTFFANLVYSNSIFNILIAIMTQYRFMANKTTIFWKLSLVIFLRFWPFECHFLINVFLIKTNVHRILYLNFINIYFSLGLEALHVC